MRLALRNFDPPLSLQNKQKNDLQFYVYCARMGFEKEDQLAAVCVL